jgi:hypothetical protein
MHSPCVEKSINSHLLQKNGIIDNIIEAGHVIQIKLNEYHKMITEGPVAFNRIGINKANSLPLFCNYHDTNVFKPIESSFKIDDYRSQLLYSYRAVCAEVRKKEINIEADNRILKAKTLDKRENKDFLEMTKLSLSGEKIGFNDIMKLKLDIESELFTESKDLFGFKIFNYAFIGICMSATFTPETSDPNVDSNPILLDAILKKERLNPIIIHLIPQKQNLFILLGYHKNLVDSEILKYIDSWDALDKTQLQKKITDLITNKVETWCISESLYKRIPQSVKQRYIDYWRSSLSIPPTYAPIDFNLFEGEK